ncbi:energy-coupling factor transporter transmembrane component T family protein [Gorillibacterium timonense]|uniref:energy-coupling factor transporter transmembrane component T family protein n=1 Tax=Gorillibacterium timonense TaxID=1689269 RepID=UPI00071D2D56|nr:energy-coupling factor transporter transmembrane component T [Gorillibacterium timonense]
MSSTAFYLYQKRNSWPERWDPRIKIVSVLLFGAALLITRNPELKTVQLLLLFIVWGMARLPWRTLLYTLLSLTLFFASTMIYQAILLSDPADVFIAAGPLHFSTRGALNGLMMCEQIAGIVLLLSLLVRTTSPIVLAEGLELLLKPLTRWRLPVHEAVMMFSIALRFLPILVEEFDKIRKAQIARGGGFHRKGVFTRFGGVLPMLMPLFVMSILRAKELAIAMESRCYQGDEGRTPIRNYRFQAVDYAVLGFSTLHFLLIWIW